MTLKHNNTGSRLQNISGKAVFCNLLLAAALSTGFISCGDKKQAESMVAPQGMSVVDLSRYGKPFAIFVPDTTAVKLLITEQNTGALDIKVGKNFAITINEQAADLEMLKADIKDNEVYKLKGFITDEPSAILWETSWGSENTQAQFHFALNKKIGNADYSFEDIKDPDANSFSKEAIQKMFDSCKNIIEVKKENKS